MRFVPMLFWLAAAGHAAASEPPGGRLSGYQQMAPATRAMQDDDTANPGMLWVLEGRAQWSRPGDAGGPACAGCHGAVETSMRGVARRYPAIDPASGRPASLADRITSCRSGRQRAPPWPAESRELLSLLALLSLQSRGLPILAGAEAPLRPYREAGERLFRQRMGQLDLACAHCHEERSGMRLGGTLIPQAHPTAYPLYRLEWQSLGSLQRRIRGCMAGVRAEPFEFGAPELLALEVFLMWRARGMTLESPGVRP